MVLKELSLRALCVASSTQLSFGMKAERPRCWHYLSPKY
jgi:hypothetical protein